MGDASHLVKRRGFWGLSFAAGCFDEGDHCPTLVTYGPHGKALDLITLGTTSREPAASKAAIAAGRGWVAADDGVHSYVLWWDAFLTVNDRRTDAVCCEAGVRGEESAFVFAQRYVVDDGKLVKLGRPKLLGPVDSAFEAPVLFPPPWKPGKTQSRKKKAKPSPGRPKTRRA
ncbi:MAG: hypothetical protein PHQ91_16210 [Thermoanaerobaculaceae bacterium]|nr:hypothetical protein [Thermoanaerobaculaceae bacterium]